MADCASEAPSMANTAPQFLPSSFIIDTQDVERLRLSSNLSIEAFLTTLVSPTQSLARPTISHFYVGAVGLGSSGRIFRGVNLEFAGLPLHNSVHAEQFLIANAAQNGERQLRFIAVSAAPCGHCRQFLQELRGATDLRVLIADADAETQSLSYFLPHRFGPNDVMHGEFPLLLEPRDNRLSLMQKEGNFSRPRNASICNSEEIHLNSTLTMDGSNAPGPAIASRITKELSGAGGTNGMLDKTHRPDITGVRNSESSCLLENSSGKLSLENHAVKSSDLCSSSSDGQHASGCDLNDDSYFSAISCLKFVALEAANRSHAPYSTSPSGMALLTRKGKIYSGSYLESVAFNPSLPPLQAALVAFVSKDGGSYDDIVQALLVEKEDAAVQFAATTKLALEKISPGCLFQVYHAIKND